MLGKPFCIYFSVLHVFCLAALAAPLLLCLCCPLVGEHHQKQNVAHKNDKMVPTQALRPYCILYNDRQEHHMKKTTSGCFYLYQFSWTIPSELWAHQQATMCVWILGGKGCHKWQHCDRPANNCAALWQSKRPSVLLSEPKIPHKYTQNASGFRLIDRAANDTD